MQRARIPMWKAKIAALWPDAHFNEPATRHAIEAAQKAVGVLFPRELIELLAECDGFHAHYGTDIIWRASPHAEPHESIVEQNRTMRETPDFAELYAPFDSLLFIGAEGGGSLFALRIQDGAATDEVVLWDHEDDSRAIISTGGLGGYLEYAARMWS